MASTLFYLTTRLLPQTTGVKILPPGGLPGVTRTDMLRAIGCVRDAVGWQCIAAKWLCDEKAGDGLLKSTEAHSWQEWREKRRAAKIDVFTHQRIAELAYLDWLVPESPRTEKGRARYIECDFKTYAANYRDHLVTMQNWLSGKESSAWHDMAGFLYGDIAVGS